jgi:hypothetical protein
MSPGDENTPSPGDQGRGLAFGDLQQKDEGDSTTLSDPSAIPPGLEFLFDFGLGRYLQAHTPEHLADVWHVVTEAANDIDARSAA